MPRPVAALPALAVFLTVARAAPGDGPTGQPRYYPTRVGAKWVYKMAEGGEMVVVVTAVEEKGGAKLVTEGMEVRGKVRPVRTVSVSDKGLFLTAAAGETYDPPECLLKLPVKPGEKWDGPGPGKVVTRDKKAAPKSTVTVREPEEVKVPAGKYEAVPVVTESTVGGRPVRTTVWFAPGVGVVKAAHKVGDREEEVVLELRSFTPGKD